MNYSDISYQKELVLPANIATKADLSRLVREAEKIDSYLTTRDVRAKAGSVSTEQISVSDQMTAFMTANGLEFGNSQQRTGLVVRLRQLKDSVPVVHITFATEADQESLEQLVAWIRRSVHRQAVISVGLQPNLIGGIYVRTTNHVYDLSVRAQLAGSRHLLLEAVEAVRERG